MTRLLIANRGEIALRIARSVADLGLDPVAIHGTDERDALHVTRATAAIALPRSGAAAYLDGDAIVAAAVQAKCWGVHPGYGFLAEQARFGAACEAAGLVFVGPTPAQLALFGSKLASHELARGCRVPVLPASPALHDERALETFRAELGRHTTIVIKAAAGGGGRGMRVVASGDDAAAAWRACRGEAHSAFGDDTVYAEQYLTRARHLEVQIVGDGQGGVTHLWERDCSIQRRHQKLIEIAPAPNLSADVRAAIIDAALAMARHARYRGLGTFEFLLDMESSEWFFIEANARLQVEHTVTEEVLGLDLVLLQLQIARGACLADVGLAAAPPPPRACAVQLRVNAETVSASGEPRAVGGRVTRFEPASGPGVRVDTATAAGFVPNPAFDSLIGKLIVSERSGDFERLRGRVQRALTEFVIEGMETNLDFLAALVADPAFARHAMHTTYIEHNLATLLARMPTRGAVAASDSADPSTFKLRNPAPDGAVAILAPMRGSVIALEVEVGARVQRGRSVAVLEAMKMHHVVEAQANGTVVAIAVQLGEVVDDAQPLVYLAGEAAGDEAEHAPQDLDLSAARADLDEVVARHARGLDVARPAAVARRRKVGGRTARENVADLCDADSFIEYGALAIAAQRRRRTLEDLTAATPADGMIAGFGTVNAAYFGADAARCAVLAYDYTVLAGTQGHTNHKKKDRLFELAAEWQTPVVFFTEGGGGRPGDVDADDLTMSWLDLKTFATWPKLSGIAPRIAVNFGRCYAGNAVIFGCADVTIATSNSNIGLAGPAMIEGGGLGRYRPEDIGPIEVQTRNGVVDIACADEREATACARQLLGYFQGRISEWQAVDQRRLRHHVPENRLRVYNVRKVIADLADIGSVLELRPHYGVGLITAFVRIEGEPFGLIANDPRHLGGAIDGDGGEKGGRFLQLCDTYGVPVISLCDTPGFMVGPESEKTAAVRRGSRLIVASANLSVPLYCVILRKGYGLGAQAMCGGSTQQAFFTVGWPTAELGPMGLEGAVELGFRKELEATTSTQERHALFQQLVGRMYEKGKAVSVASAFEIDAVIDPIDTRAWLLRGLRAAGRTRRPSRRYVDVW